jgi:type IV pilus assembly protein PilY1
MSNQLNLGIAKGMIMKISLRKNTWTSVGCAIALLAGAPAMADDTELLLITPDPRFNPKPNVMFILDTSGSMDTVENTIAPYDSTQAYGGSCDIGAIYWTDVDVLPVCSVANTQWVYKTSFHCEFASNQIAGIGSFTNTMVQFRDGGKDGSGSGPFRWQYIAPGYHTQPIECQADSGTHGDGRATFLWADNGTNLPDPWIDDPTQELSWGSAPRNLGYTFYDGNYLNWKNSPQAVQMDRLDIMKAVTTKVLSSVNNLNVGLMRFNNQAGGPVVLGVTDLDANRQDVLDAIDDLPHNGWTPLSETLYESALYWRGMPAHYGQLINENPTDPLALASTSPEVYQQPVWDSCTKNYNVLLTDGQPTRDDDAPGLVPTLPNFASAMGRSTCTFNTMGDCLDDISEYLSVEDIDPNTPGDQIVTTHTIGFAIDLEILKDTAVNSGGQYFLADDVESLTKTLLAIIANINDRSLSFSAPAVSVNTFNRTQNLNDLYLTMFGAKAKAHWPGNLKKYRITDRNITDANGVAAVDPATGFFYNTAKSFWTAGSADGNDVRLGGAAHNLPDPATRNLYTNNGGGSDLTTAANQITPSNSGAFQLSDFGLTGSTGEPTMDEIIRWSRGEDLRNEDNNIATNVRYAMGDPLHSQPAAIVYGGTPASPDIVVFTATNDGYLHAIDGNTGQELWSFVPKELLSNFTRLYFDPNSKYKQYGIDGNVVPIVKDANKNGIVDGTDFVYLVFGMRRGGNSYYALDVTNKFAPRLMWQANYPEMGESWSSPVVTRMFISGAAQNADKAVVVLGGGYDSTHDTDTHPNTPDGVGAGVHILDLESGAELWRAGADAGADLPLSTMTRAMPNDIRVIDLSGNGYADRMYASDLGGQIWRFDVNNGQNASNVIAGGVIARIGAEGLATPSSAETRRFYTSPDVSLFNDNVQDRRFIAVSIGSGYRAHPFDLKAVDHFFSFRDPDVFNKLTQAEYDGYSIATINDLVEVSGSKQVVINPTDRGWKFMLPSNQKVLSDSITFDNQVFFVAFSPDSNAAATCAAGKGTNYLYRVSVVNGDPIVNNLDTLAAADADAARRQTLQQGGIAPTPTVLFPSPDDANCTGADCSPPPIMCIGVECTDPGFENNPVRTLWTQDGIQ